jgi:hypothetical protein
MSTVAEIFVTACFSYLLTQIFCCCSHSWPFQWSTLLHGFTWNCKFSLRLATTFIEEVGCDWCDSNFRNVWSLDNLSVAPWGRCSNFFKRLTFQHNLLTVSVSDLIRSVVLQAPFRWTVSICRPSFSHLSSMKLRVAFITSCEKRHFISDWLDAEMCRRYAAKLTT